MSLDSSLHVVSTPPTCKVGIVGLGTVGSAVARRLTGRDAVRGVTLTHVCDRRAAEKRRHFNDTGVTWTAAIEDLLRSDVHVIVETVGGVDPAAGWIRDALLAGKSVVTANKQVIAREGWPLLTLAARQGRQLRFEAAVGGAMPIVRAIGDGLAGDRLTRVPRWLALFYNHKREEKHDACIGLGIRRCGRVPVDARGARKSGALQSAHRRADALVRCLRRHFSSDCRCASRQRVVKQLKP